MKDSDLRALGQRVLDGLRPLDADPVLAALLTKRREACARIDEILRYRATDPDLSVPRARAISATDKFLAGESAPTDNVLSPADEHHEKVVREYAEERALREIVIELDKRIVVARRGAGRTLAAELQLADVAQQMRAEIAARAEALFAAFCVANLLAARLDDREIPRPALGEDGNALTRALADVVLEAVKAGAVDVPEARLQIIRRASNFGEMPRSLA